MTCVIHRKYIYVADRLSGLQKNQIKGKNYPELMKDIKPHIQETL